LRLEVEDDAGVLDGAPVFGVGLSNLHERLHARYGAQATLRLVPLVPAGVVARIELPCAC
jgi:LytS/YehU family sensor histidine kinase